MADFYVPRGIFVVHIEKELCVQFQVSQAKV